MKYSYFAGPKELATTTILAATCLLNSYCVGGAEGQANSSLAEAEASLRGVYSFDSEIGRDHRTFSGQVQRIHEDGRVEEVPTRYVHIEPGLHYLDGEHWRETITTFTPEADGAAVLTGPHKVWLKRNLNQNGAVKLLTPDKREIAINPVEIVYYDRKDGRTVELGRIRDSLGTIPQPSGH